MSENEKMPVQPNNSSDTNKINTPSENAPSPSTPNATAPVSNPSFNERNNERKKRPFGFHKKNSSHKPPQGKPQGNGKKIHITPIGGLGEIGRNMTAFEYENEIILIDCGVMFPNEDYFGVDLVLADFQILKSKAKNIKALLITHGHEDHIGGIPYFLKEFPGVPVFAPKMAMELIKGKLNDHKLNYDRKKLFTIEKNKKISVTPSFDVSFIEVNHSIPDSFGMAIETPLGTIIHTGDFKIESDSLNDSEFDFHQFAKFGDKGVLLLCSDSTNIEKSREVTTEREVCENIEGIIQNAKGRVILSTFASNVTRIAKLIEAAGRIDRRVCVIGRNMENNVEIAKKLGYINGKNTTLVKMQSIKNYPDDKILIITTGTQGEILSSLTRMSSNTHKMIKLKTNDSIVISASVIPGNEKPVSKVLDNLYTKGVNVYYSRNAHVHVSGHGSADNLMTMMRLIKPKFFLPVHGERRHLILHTHLAHKMGIPTSNTVVAQNGAVVELTQNEFKPIKQLPLKTLVVEDRRAGDYSKIMNDRKSLSNDGFVFVLLNSLSSLEKRWSSNVITRGFLMPQQENEFIMKVQKIIDDTINDEKVADFTDKELVETLKKSLKLIIDKKYSKNPMLEIKFLELDN